MTLLSAVLAALGAGATVAGAAISIAGTVSLRPDWDYKGAAIAAVGCWMQFAASVLTSDLISAVISGLCGVWWIWHWWRTRPKGRRRKALKQWGAKSRARVEALVRQMTPSPIPSPVGGIR